MSSLRELIQRANATGNIPVSNGILAKAAKERNEESEKKAVAQMAGVLGRVESHIGFCVSKLQASRRAVKSRKGSLDKVNRAAAYFGETGNPLPVLREMGDTYAGRDFCLGIGVDPDALESEEWEVPEGWTPAPDPAGESVDLPEE